MVSLLVHPMVELVRVDMSLIAAVAAEKIREKRRQERKQFKIDRAAAMLEAAVAAETVITTGQVPSTLTGTSTPDANVAGAEEDEGADEGDENGAGAASPATTSAETIIDVNTLTPQTFLVRPTRPDANRNRGKNAFKRKPKPKPVAPAQATADGPATGAAAAGESPSASPAAGGVVPAAAAATPVSSAPAALGPTHLESTGGPDEEDEEDDFDESVVEEMEHLQLGLEEAWFLSAALGVLRIHDPVTVGDCVPSCASQLTRRTRSYPTTSSSPNSSPRPRSPTRSPRSHPTGSSPTTPSSSPTSPTTTSAPSGGSSSPGSSSAATGSCTAAGPSSRTPRECCRLLDPAPPHPETPSAGSGGLVCGTLMAALRASSSPCTWTRETARPRPTARKIGTKSA